ncbi:MAG TPA: C25 family cysteine peptidase, partial [Tepidisphaeraceae bacterium]
MTRPKRLFIIAPDRFYSILAEYVRHKPASLRTELVSLEQVLKTTEGVDDPERLKRFLYTAWRERDLGYVLLVGDVDVMPVRYMVLDRVTPAAFDYAFYPSDLYYADLAKADGSFESWNARKEGFHAGFFGEVRGEKNKDDPINYDQVNYRPAVAVGRWPVSTADELRIVVSKSIEYEETVTNGTHPGMGKVAFFHPGGWVDARGRLGRFAGALPAGWQPKVFFFGNAHDNGAADTTPNEGNLLAALNGGAALVIHAGHGSERTWEGCFPAPALGRVHNRGRLPVMISAGCSTAYFAPLAPYDGYVDVAGKPHAGTYAGEVFTSPPPPPSPYQSGRFNPTGLGEQLLKRGPDGAVVYIGCCTGSQPCALSLVDGFVRGLRRSPQPRVGDCWAD